MGDLRLFGRVPVIILLFVMFSIAAPLQAGTVNINKADAATLQHYLSGVGEIKAKAIVAYRNKHGKFNSPDDLEKVPGIGKATIRKNRKNISVSKGVTRLSKKSKKTKIKTSSRSKQKGSGNG